MIHNRIQGALSLAEQQERTPARIWLTHADWDALLSCFNHTPSYVRYSGTPVTLDTYGQETRLVDSDGCCVYF